jgi:hypothetical protein
MGYVDRLIGWAGMHPYLSAAGLLITFLGGGMALGQLYKSKDSDGTAAAITIDSHTLAPTPALTVAAKNATVKGTPHYDWYDAELNVGVVIEKYDDTPLFGHNVTNMFRVMQDKTPERYREAMNAFKQRPKKIVKSERWGEVINFNSEKLIGLASIIEQLGGSDDTKLVLGADAILYAEMMASTILEKPLKNRYESELYQVSNLAKYRVDAGIDTKENMNKWLQEGGWFNAVVGRYPTNEDMEGVDIGKYLLN